MSKALAGMGTGPVECPGFWLVWEQGLVEGPRLPLLHQAWRKQRLPVNALLVVSS